MIAKILKKHKNDVFRLTELIDPTAKIVAPKGVYADIQEFVQCMKMKTWILSNWEWLAEQRRRFWKIEGNV